jgi:hypothetical protein
LLWLSTPEAVAMTLSFASAICSALGTDDEEFAAGDLFPGEVPEGISEGVLVGLITEILPSTNSTVKTVDHAQLAIHYSEKAPGSIDDMSRAGNILFKTEGAGADVKGNLHGFFPIVNGPVLRRSKNNLFVRIKDEGVILDSATGSTLTITMTGQHIAVMAYGMTVAEATRILSGRF